MHPTKWPLLASIWESRRALGDDLPDAKDPLITLQTLKALKSLKSLQSLQSLREMQALERSPVNWPRIASHNFIFYSANNEQRIIRLDKALGRAQEAGTFAPHWLRLPDVGNPHFVPEQADAAHTSWESGCRRAVIWLVCLLLLGGVLLFVKLFKHFTRKAIGINGSPSHRWHEIVIDATSRPRLGDEDNYRTPAGENVAESPPPYSDCSQFGARDGNKRPVNLEEPPPPYSACYVSFSKSKDGVPSVHIYNESAHSFSEEPQSNGHDLKGDKPDKPGGRNVITISSIKPGREGREEGIIEMIIPSSAGGAPREAHHVVTIA